MAFEADKLTDREVRLIRHVTDCVSKSILFEISEMMQAMAASVSPTADYQHPSAPIMRVADAIGEKASTMPGKVITY